MKQQQESGYNLDLSNKEMSKKSTNPGDTIPIDNSVNHYELPNLAQRIFHSFKLIVIVLYDFTNKEQEIIQRCFRTGNCNHIN